MWNKQSRKIMVCSLAALLFLTTVSLPSVALAETEPIEQIQNEPEQNEMLQQEINEEINEEINVEPVEEFNVQDENNNEENIPSEEVNNEEEISENDTTELIPESELTEEQEEIIDNIEPVSEDELNQDGEQIVEGEIITPELENEEQEEQEEESEIPLVPPMVGAYNGKKATDYYPVYLTFTYTAYKTASYHLTRTYYLDGYEWRDKEYYTVVDPGIYYYNIDNTQSVNNVYVTVKWNPNISGNWIKWYTKDSDPGSDSWTTAEAKRSYYSSRLSSTVKNYDKNNDWIKFAMYGYGAQYNSIGTRLTKEVDDSDKSGICSWRGYFKIHNSGSAATGINPAGGVLGTLTISFERSDEGFYDFSYPDN